MSLDIDRLSTALVAHHGARIGEARETTWRCGGAWRTVTRIDDTPIPEQVGRRKLVSEVDIYAPDRAVAIAAAEALVARIAYRLGMGWGRYTRPRSLSLIHVASARYGHGQHQMIRLEETL
jgi:hypothetical protein